MTFTEILTRLREIASAIVLLCVIVCAPALSIALGVLGWTALREGLAPLSDLREIAAEIHMEQSAVLESQREIQRQNELILERLKAIEVTPKRPVGQP